MADQDQNSLTRRSFLKEAIWGGCLAGLGGLVGLAIARSRRSGLVWQIDPTKCIACGRCATSCVLQPSAVRCVHDFKVCGYCRICFGFFGPEPYAINEGAENQLCPTGAIIRRFVEDPYYQYTIDQSLCIGCGKCVKGCTAFGNGSLRLQIKHDLCVRCNACSIAAVCPTGAISRVPATSSYLWGVEE